MDGLSSGDVKELLLVMAIPDCCLSQGPKAISRHDWNIVDCDAN